MASRRQYNPNSPPSYLKKPGSLEVDVASGRIQKGDDIRGMKNIAKESIAKFEGIRKLSVNSIQILCMIFTKKAK